jgi:hypothetical protein
VAGAPKISYGAVGTEVGGGKRKACCQEVANIEAKACGSVRVEGSLKTPSPLVGDGGHRACGCAAAGVMVKSCCPKLGDEVLDSASSWPLLKILKIAIELDQ